MAKRPSQADDAGQLEARRLHREGKVRSSVAARAKQVAEQSIISAKEAVIAAGKYFTELTGISSGVTIDEVERDEIEGRKYWMVTLGYTEPTSNLPFSLGTKKVYKVFQVDATSGNVLSMKIRDI